MLAAILPLVIFFLLLTVGTTYYFSKSALTNIAELWLSSRLAEAMDIVREQEAILHEYGLEKVPASITKAKMDSCAMMETVEIGKLGYLFAVDHDGTITAHPNKRHIGRSVGNETWFKKLNPGSGKIIHTDRNGRNLAMYGYFAPWKWYVFAADPEREIYGAAKRMKPYIVALGLVVSIVLALTMMLLTRRLMEPLRALTQGAEKIGEGDLSTRIALHSKDEFGRLAQVFNRMTSRLQETHTSLQHKEEYFRALTENTYDIIIILDDRGTILYTSPSMERTLGYANGTLHGRNAAEFIHQKHAEFFERLTNLKNQSPDTWGQIEIECRHQDGGWRTLETISKNLINHPAVRGFVINARDITNRKAAEMALQQANQVLEQRVSERTSELTSINSQLVEQIRKRERVEEALRANEQKLAAILMASPVGIAVVVEKKIDWANTTMYRMLGYEGDTLTGIHESMFYLEEQDHEQISEQISKAIGEGRIGLAQTRWIKKDGTTFDCALRSYALDPDEPSQGRIVVVSDISDAKRLEAELQRARKMEAVGTLAGGVAHDLNNILSGIVSYPDLLLMELPEGSPLRQPLKTIKNSGEMAATIVQDLLTMARRGVAVTEVVNLNTTIAEQLKSPEFFNLKKRHPKIDVSINLSQDLRNNKGSTAHLSKSIMNLIANAAEAMPVGGELSIVTRNVYLTSAIRGYEYIPPGDYVTVTVSDAGVGIQKGDIERIFEPFYTKKRMGHSGSGLGMAVVWGTMKDHGGFIDVQSTEGQGTTFCLYLPMDHGVVSAQKETVSIETYLGNGQTILVVDDSQSQRDIAKGILEKLRYRVDCASSGQAAIAYLNENRADLIVLDMIMPNGLDGLETYQRIAATNPRQRVIIASGYSETERVRAAQDLGAGQYIKKPYTIEEIGLAVKNALSA